ncbi:hypothetical protein [Pedobacter sp.]|uniref:hypothetical protein n=1 Tax=Pedobacter sp. TaxID=1411316 RepID=UPI003D7F5EB5
MKQMKIDPSQLVAIDFTAPDTNRTLRTLQPVVFKNRNIFFCHLGEDEKNCILGSGHSPYAAIKDWEIELQRRIDHHDEDDELAEFVIDSLKLSKDDVW